MARRYNRPSLNILLVPHLILYLVTMHISIMVLICFNKISSYHAWTLYMNPFWMSTSNKDLLPSSRSALLHRRRCITMRMLVLFLGKHLFIDRKSEVTHQARRIKPSQTLTRSRLHHRFLNNSILSPFNINGRAVVIF